MKISQVIHSLEQLAPPSYQEAYDNSRLLTGDSNVTLTAALITLDCTEVIVQEAIDNNCNLIIAHHPIVFSGLKSLTGKNYVERTIIKAIKNDICIYAIHTNLDNVMNGVNRKICNIIGLQDLKILAPKKNTLLKLVTFIPNENAQEVLDKLYEVGAGEIGNYSNCSFSTGGEGSFKPNNNANPHIGKNNQIEQVNETRVELMLPAYLEHSVIATLKNVHPYEEVAYYINKLNNTNQEIGAGMYGELQEPMDSKLFMDKLKSDFNLKIIKHTHIHKKEVKRIAVCGGSGSFLLSDAKRINADVYITADFKYHEYFDAENQIIIMDIGHYESEVFTKELIYDFLNEKFTNIALNLSELTTNPINYY